MLRLITGSAASLCFFVLVGCSSTQATRSAWNMEMVDTVSIELPDSLYNPYFGFGSAKLEASGILILRAPDHRSLIEYDLKGRKALRTIPTVYDSMDPFVFNFIPGDSAYMVFYNPALHQGYHDHFIGIASRSAVSFPGYNYTGSAIRTREHSWIRWDSSTLPNPFGMEPRVYADSSIILPCFYNAVPGTTRYEQNAKGDFVRIYPWSAHRSAQFLPTSFADRVPEGSLFGKNHAWQYGWFEEDRVIWSHGIDNSIFSYDLKTDRLNVISRAHPLIPPIHGIDTSRSNMADATQYRFLQLLHDPYRDVNYRLVALPDHRGFAAILMDSEFEELGLFELPNELSSPFLVGKGGLWAFIREEQHLLRFAVLSFVKE